MNSERISGRPPLGSERSKSSRSPTLKEKGNHQSSSSEDSPDSEDYQTDENSDIHHNSTAVLSESYECTRSHDTPGIREGFKQRSLSRGIYYQPECYFTLEELKSRSQLRNDNSNYLWLGIGLVILLVALIWYSIENAKPMVEKNCSFDQLEKEFPMEEKNLWKSLQVGIEAVLNNNRPDPAVYLFLHPGSSLPEKLIREIAKTAASCFNPSLQPMEFGNKDFTSEEANEDYGVVIEKYKTKVKGGGALVVANLNEIPGKCARALHAICDVHSPIVRNVVIFMTLITSTEHEENPIEIAESTLFNLWNSSMKRNELDALITRVTDQVFRLRSR